MEVQQRSHEELVEVFFLLAFGFVVLLSLVLLQSSYPPLGLLSSKNLLHVSFSPLDALNLVEEATEFLLHVVNCDWLFLVAVTTLVDHLKSFLSVNAGLCLQEGCPGGAIVRVIVLLPDDGSYRRGVVPSR